MSEHENRRQGSDAAAVVDVIVGGLQLALEFGWGLIEVSLSLLFGLLRG